MDLLLPYLLSYVIAPTILFGFFCRCCAASLKWYWGITYIILSSALALLSITIPLSGPLFTISEILLLALCGIVFIKSKPVRSFSVSALTISVFSIANETTQAIGHWIAANLDAANMTILKYLDSAVKALLIALLLLLFYFILKFFYSSINDHDNSALLLLMIPVLFISLVEKIISDAVYGNVFVWDTDKGLVAPIANDIEILFLQLFACIGLFSALTAYRKLINSFRNEQTIKLLEQQTHEQETYVQEAQLRYEQTRAFRHDVKNHLLVLGSLLKDDKSEDAYNYLVNLEQISNDLSFPCQTGNVVVDALLRSKLAIAKQKGIYIECYAKIPKSCCVKDIDWCIVLSNAIDNAVKENDFVTLGERAIRILGKLKGNFYLLHIENPCTQISILPKAGTGLTNIKAVIQKYNGSVDIEIINNTFKLNMLFVISQQ